MNLLEIKYDRLSENEIFLLNIFDGIEEFVSDIHPDLIFYMNCDKVLFKYDSKTRILWYSFYDIFLFICDKSMVNHTKTNDLFQFIVVKYLKLEVVATFWTIKRCCD